MLKGVETPEFSNEKRLAAAVSVCFNALIAILKFVAALWTGSVSLLSDALHSATDLVASSITFFSVRISSVPPDEHHPFGHGKIESLTGFGEAIMVLIAVIWIAVEAIRRLVSGTGLREGGLRFGLVVMALSAIGALLASGYVLRVARRTGSPALEVNSRHLGIDFITSLGVFVGLAITRITGIAYADPIVALLLAIWMTYGAARLCLNAFQELIDVRLSEAEIEKIETILNSDDRLVSFHRMRTRRSGSVRNVDLHIVVPREWTVVQAHEVADSLEKRIRAELAPAEVVIHVDPFDESKAVSARERPDG